MSYWNPDIGAILNQEDVDNSVLDDAVLYGVPLFPNTDALEIKDAVTANAVAHDYLDDGKQIIIYRDSASQKIIAFVENELFRQTPEQGAAVDVATSIAATGPIRVVAQNSTTAWAIYATTATGGSLVMTKLTISGNTITVGSNTTILAITAGYIVCSLAAILLDTNKISVAYRQSNNVAATAAINCTQIKSLDSTPVVATPAASSITKTSNSLNVSINSISKLSTDLVACAGAIVSGAGLVASFDGFDADTPALDDDEAISANVAVAAHDTSADSLVVMLHNSTANTQSYAKITGVGTGTLVETALTGSTSEKFSNLAGMVKDMISGFAVALTGYYFGCVFRTANETIMLQNRFTFDPKSSDVDTALSTGGTQNCESVAKMNSAGTAFSVVFRDGVTNDIYITRYR